MIRLLSTLEKACDRKTFFDLLVDGFEDLLNITSALFLAYDQTKEIWSSEGALVYGLSSEILFDYLTRIHLMDPFVTSGWVKRNESRGALYVDFVSEEEFSRSEFAHEFLSRVPIRYGKRNDYPSLREDIHSLHILFACQNQTSFRYKKHSQY